MARLLGLVGVVALLALVGLSLYFGFSTETVEPREVTVSIANDELGL